MLIKPSENALLNVELVSIFLNAVSFSRINHQLGFHTCVFQTTIEFVSLADSYTAIVDAMEQQGRRAAVAISVMGESIVIPLAVVIRTLPIYNAHGSVKV